MKNVLIPTDFSESASYASDLGVEIAKKMNTGVTFLHLISTPVDWRKLPLEKESLYPETKAAIGEAKDQLVKLERRAEKNGVEISSSLIFNTGIEEIHKYINKEHYSLVVMGTHGQKGFNKMAGTNTHKVMSKSPVPVLAVKRGDGPVLPKNIAIASDFENESLADFEMIMEIAIALGAEIQLLYVNTPYNFRESTEIEEKLNRFLQKYSGQNVKHTVINAHDEQRGIEKFLKNCHCDMLGVITHGRAGLSPLYRKSISEGLINKLEMPVLSINSNE
ncbi:universal stress protein [Salinimicrobium flavum]|uniref:Universal stress protein n=1 Tax=Salinimicrobium flavum TaxID=1737065 RepID=A0ABW5J061_9FLAO